MIKRRQIIFALPASLLCLAKASQATAAGPKIGLIFVSQSTCPYCQAIAPSLYELQQRTGLDVLVASMDGQGMHPFLSVEDGRVHPLTRGYSKVPVVLVYNTRLDRVTHEVQGLSTTRRFVARLSLAMRQSAHL